MDQASAIHKARTSFAENTTPEVLTEYIRKRGSKWVILSKKGKVLGTYDSHKAAAKRLGQIEYFKHRGESLEIFDQAVATVRAGVPSSTLSESLQIIASCMADEPEDGDPLTEEIGRQVLRLTAGVIKEASAMGGWWYNVKTGKSIDVRDEIGGGTNDHVGWMFLSGADNYKKLGLKLSDETVQAMADFYDTGDVSDEYMEALQETKRQLSEKGWVRVLSYEKEAAFQFDVNTVNVEAIQKAVTKLGLSPIVVTVEDFDQNYYASLPYSDFLGVKSWAHMEKLSQEHRAGMREATQPFDIVSHDGSSLVLFIKDRSGMPANPVGRTWMNGMDYRIEPIEKSGRPVINTFVSNLEIKYLLDYINGTNMSRKNPTQLTVLQIASETPHARTEGTMARVKTIKVVSPSSSLRDDGYIEIDGVKYTASYLPSSGWDDLERVAYEIKKGGYNTRKIDYFFKQMSGHGFKKQE